MTSARRHYRVDPTLPEEEAEAWAPHLAERGWSRTESEDWRFWLCGGYPDRDFYRALRPDQWVSRIPGIGALAVKRDLCENARWARRWAGTDEPYRDHPMGFLIPAERAHWEQAAAQHPEYTWLLKPQASRCGEGISLISDPRDVPTSGRWIAQHYISRPHLLDGYKYNLRFYVLITSLDPLIFYLHDVATCRFTSRPFTMDPAHFGDRFVHLTNTAIQELNTDVKWSKRNSEIQPYLARLRQEGIDDEKLLRDVRDAVARLVIAAREQALMDSQLSTLRLETSFDLLSIDVQIDEDLRPWILEFNAGAPMAFSAWKGATQDEDDPEYDPRDARESYEIKAALMCDLLDLLGFARGLPRWDQRDSSSAYWQQRDHDELADCGGWRRVWPREDAARMQSRFPVLRPQDRLLAASHCAGIPRETPRYSPEDSVKALPFSEGLVLHEGVGCELHYLDAIAAVVWLSIDDGLGVAETVDQLVSVFGDDDRERIESDIWGLLTVWSQKGLIRALHGEPFESRTSQGDQETSVEERRIQVSGSKIGDVLQVFEDSISAAPPEPSTNAELPLELPLPGIRSLLFSSATQGSQREPVPISPPRALQLLLAAAHQPCRPDLGDTVRLLDWLQSIRLEEVTASLDG